MTAYTADTYRILLDSVPHVMMRVEYEQPVWKVRYVNKSVERWGYTQEDFTSDKKTWNDLLHPDDRVVALKNCQDYLDKGINHFQLQYRIQTKAGASIYVVDYCNVTRNPDGSMSGVDSYLVENLDASHSTNTESDIAVKRRMALNDILLTIQDANSNPEMAVQFILDRVGALLDCSRALLFKDSPDHKTCKVEYEWDNYGISSVKDLDYAVTYSTGMPEIYVALQTTGVLLVNAGEIPENCKEEFEAEGLVSSAIFAVYQYGDHYGFVCFDDCVIQRTWDSETANFLKVIANLLSNVIMNLQSAQYTAGYENTFRTLALRDYLTGLPNHFPYDSDFADAVLAASTAGTPAYIVMIALNNIDEIRNNYGLKGAEQVAKAVAAELEKTRAETMGDQAVLYRIAGTVFAVIVQPGDIGPLKKFAQKVAERGQKPWQAGERQLTCLLNVSAVPFGLKTTDPDKVAKNLDAANVKSAHSTGLRLVIEETEA